MLGGTIQGNRVEGSGKGAGISVFDNAGFSMQDSAKIDVNNDIYLTNGRKIAVTGVLTNSLRPLGCITPETYTEGTQVLEAEGGVTLANEAAKFTVTPSPTPPISWSINMLGMLSAN